jgi:hypothetical protein
VKTTAATTSTNLDIGNDVDLFLEKKIRLVTEGLSHQYADRLYNKISKENALSITDFIVSMKTEINLSNHHIKNSIMALSLLSQFYNNEKSFKEMTRKDVLSYLDRLRKPDSADPLHKWIGSYNLNRALCITFFKWLYHPDLEPSKRSKGNNKNDSNHSNNPRKILVVDDDPDLTSLFEMIKLCDCDSFSFANALYILIFKF